MDTDQIQGWDSLHPKQQKLYELLLSRKGDDALTLDDMREELGEEWINTVVHHLRQLEKKGYIRRQGESGQIEVLSAPVRDIVYLNLYGTVGCGPGFFNDGNVRDRIPLPAKQFRVSGDSFLVQARGDSMEPLVHDGDLVLVDRSPVANGDTAVVVHGKGAVLKKFYVENQYIILQSLNPKYEPIVASPDDVQPVGVARGVVRNFQNDLKVGKNRSN